MKHIGWCLDQMQIAVGELPDGISGKDKFQASQVLVKMDKLVKILRKIVTDEKFRARLGRLEASGDTKVRLEAQEAEELFEKLRGTVIYVEEKIALLRKVAVHDPAKWEDYRDNITQHIYYLFQDNRGQLHTVFLEIVHTEEELKRIIADEEHLAEILAA